MDTDKTLRDELLHLLQGGNAHMAFDEAVADFPMDRINERPPNVPYTPWHLLEHIRGAQVDILNFITKPYYQEPKWPDDYWPGPDATADEGEWNETLFLFRQDLGVIEQIASDPQTDLSARVPHGTGQTILREILLVADHNAHHIGEFAILRQVMGTWGSRK